MEGRGCLLAARSEPRRGEQMEEIPTETTAEARCYGSDGHEPFASLQGMAEIYYIFTARGHALFGLTLCFRCAELQHHLGVYQRDGPY